jgi:fatty acid desaturase
MVKNMGLTDRLVRIAVAIMIAALYFTGQIWGKAALVLGIIAVILVITGIIGTCLMYIPFKLDSREKRPDQN